MSEDNTKLTGIAQHLKACGFSTKKETWNDWLEKFKNPEATKEDLISLLHRGFEVEDANCVERVLFYFEVAGMDDKKYSFLSRKAYATLCAKFLKEYSSAQGTAREGLYEDARVVYALMDFYTPKRVYGIRRAQDSSESKFEAQVTITFLRHFAGFKVWSMGTYAHIPDYWHLYHTDKAKLDTIRIPQAKIDALHLWAIYALEASRCFEVLFVICAFQKLSSAVLKHLQNFSVKNEQPACSSFEQAYQRGSMPAQLYILGKNFRSFMARNRLKELEGRRGRRKTT